MKTFDGKAIADGLFTTKNGHFGLIGTRCRSCGSVYFPQTVSCRNPECGGKSVETDVISPDGTLYTWTEQHYPPPPPFRMDEWAPYLIGVVELDDGIRVMGIIEGCTAATIEIGMRMRVDARSLFRDEEGQAVGTYVFVPSEKLETIP